MIRFIHAADIHLDSPLRGLAAYEGAPVEHLRTATRGAFTRLIDRAVDEAVDFVVIAGDLYDGDWRDYNTGLFFCREMGRLNQAAIPAFVLYGNHDAESEITKRLPLPANVRVFSARAAETFRLDELRVALHGRSFREAATTENLVPGYPPPVPGWFNIGVLHTALEGNAAHATYAPCTLAELRAREYDYWALGHVHEFAVLSEDPWVVFPGNLQGRHIRECGPRGAMLVSIDGGRVAVERLLVDGVRWHHLQIDASGLATFDQTVAAVGAELAQLATQHGGIETLAVRVSLAGRSAAHGALFGLEQQLRAEVLATAAGLAGDRLWVEKVKIATSPQLDPAVLAAQGDAIADLRTYLEQAAADPALQAAIGTLLRELADKAPPDLVRALPELQQIRQGEIAPVLERVAPSLLARLAAGR
jgi:DNA repair exonuclease